MEIISIKEESESDNESLEYLEPITSHINNRTKIKKTKKFVGNKNTQKDSENENILDRVGGFRSFCESSEEGKKKNEENQNLHKCNVCSLTFKFRCRLIRHYRVHTGERPYKCPECNKAFTRSNHLLRHRKTHPVKVSSLYNVREKLSKKCNICEREFATRSSFIRHQRVHTGERPYKCDICGFTFSQSGTLLQHTRIHKSEKPFKCSICEKGFKRGSTLLKHKKTHTVRKSVPRKKKAKKVEEIKHEPPKFELIICDTSEEKKSDYRCYVCEKVFKFQSQLITHERCHTGERPYKCNNCEKAFTRSSHLMKHLKTHGAID